MATYSSKKYPSGSVTSAQLADGTIVAVDLASDSITTAKIADANVTSGKLATDISITNLAYTGTLTGGTGVVNLGSGQVYKDASGNVGIGTASPAVRLHVSQALNADTEVRLQNTQAGGYATSLRLLSNGSTGTSYNYIESYDATNSVNHWAIGGRGNAQTLCFTTGGAERARIDSAGRMTKPYQPAFSVTRTAGDLAASAIHVGNTVLLNNGSHYNTTNGRFTAPVTGMYAFHCYFMASGASSETAIAGQFFKNDVGFGNAVPYTRAAGQSFQGMAGHVIVPLTANDYVELRNSGSVGWYGTGTGHNAFSGYLIG
jgi:hypothetical protein